MEIKAIATREQPRDILEEDFPSLRGRLPIRGGWGYTKKGAVIIDRHDPCVDSRLPFNGVSVEYLFVEKRIYEELIIFRPQDAKFSGIKWGLIRQELVRDGDRTFDLLEFEIRAFRDHDWNQLKAEWEGPEGAVSPEFDREAHMRKRDQLQVRIKREFWFDITSFFGR